MKQFIILSLTALLCILPICSASEEQGNVEKISSENWVQLMARVRSYEEPAITELMDIVLSGRCPGTAEELIAMLKIAAGLGDSRAQELLADCYREGIGVRQNKNHANAWNNTRH